MAFKWKEPKDPQEVLDYVVEWQPPASGTKVPRLDEGDVIINSTWPNPPIGITIDSHNFDDTTVTIWFSGGTDKADYSLVNQIETQGGRTMEQTFILAVRTK